MFYLDLCNRDLAGDMNLGNFANLKNINASNNKFTNLDFLLTLPNKDKLESINFFGNEISSLDLSSLLNNFPNLKAINLDNNPLSLKNFDKLSPEKMTFLVSGVENKKIKMSSWKGTLTLDLLKTIQKLREQLANTGTNHHQEISLQHQTVIDEQQLINQPNNNFGLIISLISISLLTGLLSTYLYLKRKKLPNMRKYFLLFN